MRDRPTDRIFQVSRSLLRSVASSRTGPWPDSGYYFIGKSRTRPCPSSLIAQPFRICDCPKAVCTEKADRAIAQHGAHVIVVEDRAAAEETLHETLAHEHARQIHAFNDPQVIAGQGTIMLELLQQVSDLDVVLGPVGGGGLLSGLCIAAHHLNPRLLLYACEPLGAADAIESLRQNKIVPMTTPCTVADGLRTSLGTRTLPILRRHLTDVFLVSEEEILDGNAVLTGSPQAGNRTIERRGVSSSAAARAGASRSAGWCDSDRRKCGPGFILAVRHPCMKSRAGLDWLLS